MESINYCILLKVNLKRTIMYCRILALIFVIAINACFAKASDLPNSRTSSYYKYIYKLNPKEARTIYKKGLAEVEESFFHNLVDSVPTDSVFNTKLPQGNYLLTWAQNNELKFELRSYSNLELTIHNNYADLFLTLSDDKTDIIKNAKVKINGANVRYKAELGGYQKVKSKYLMLEIPIPSVCSYHNKPQTWRKNQHREYHKEKVSIYYESLNTGKHQVKIELVPRYTGKVILNPAHIEQMYFPVFSGNNAVKAVKVVNDVEK